MPVNFESTFNKPLIASFDGNQISSGDDIAKYITRYYVDTIKTGLGPIGTPPNAFLTADSRSSLMENILSLYYQAKNIEGLQDNIKDITSNINNLVSKGKKLQQEITNVVTQVTQTAQEIALLPIEFARLLEAVITFIKDQIDKISNLANTQVVYIFDSVPLVNDEAFLNSFEKYRVKLESIKNLPQTLASSLSDITPFNVNQKIQQLANIPSFISSLALDAKNDVTSVGLLVSDVVSKLQIAFTELLNLMQTVVDPTKATALLESLALANPSIRTIYEKLKKFLQRKSFLDKKLLKLNKKKDEAMERLKREVNDKIQKYEKVLKSKTDELQLKLQKAFSTESRITFISKTIKSAKGEIEIINKKVTPIVKEIIKNILRVQRLLSLVQASVSLILEIKSELERFVSEIKTQATKTALLFQQIGSLYQSEYNKVLGLVENQLASSVNLTQNLNNLNSEIQDPTQFANEIALSVQEIKTSTDQLTNNFNRRGLGRYTGILLAPVLSGTATAVELKQYLEFNSTKYNNIYTKAQIIVNEALDIYDEFKADVDKKPYVKKTRKIFAIRDKALSTEDLFKKLDKLSAKLDKVQKTVYDKIEELRKLIEKYIDLAKKKAEAFFEKLLKPVNSFVDDKIKKIQDKREELEDKIQEKKKLVELSQAGLFTAYSVQSLVEFGTNLSSGNYRYNSNETLINRAFDNYISADKILRKTTEKQIAAIRQVFDKVLETLKIVDSVVAIALNLANEVQTNGSAIVEQLRLSFTNNQFINKIRQTIIDFIDLLSNLQSPTQIFNFVLSTKFDFASLKNSSTISYLASLEETFFGSTRELVKNLDIKAPDSIIVYVMEELEKAYNKMTKIVTKFIEKTTNDIKSEVDKKIEKIKKNTLQKIQTRVKKALDFDGKLLTAALYSSLIAFWTGATWTNPSGDVAITLTPGSPPPPLNIPASGGTTNYVEEISKAFQTHLKTLVGTYIQQTPTGPVTIPWIGYN